MTLPLFTASSLRWVLISLVGVGLFAGGMWFDYQRDNNRGPETPAEDAGTSGLPSGSVKTLPASAAGGADSPPQDGSPFIHLEGLGSQAVVTGQSLTVRGSTTPDAILSAAGLPVPVSTDGRFETTLELEQGPNFIEFVASNLNGEQASRIVAVVSQPSP
jgi:hypothetical protein